MKIRDVSRALRAITLGGSGCVFFENQIDLSLLHALLPLKAYHDGSAFRLHLLMQYLAR
jgi:hypothetical protein